MLSPEEKLRLLSMVDILEPLSRGEIKELSRRIPDTHYQRGQTLYTPKDRSEALFMLKKGRVRIYRLGPDGREFTLTVVGAGTVFGEMSLTAQRLENAYAEAMESAVVCKMKRHDLERLVMDKPQVGLGRPEGDERPERTPLPRGGPDGGHSPQRGSRPLGGLRPSTRGERGRHDR
jgi:CRP/FNR family cyclic AMP-dependent transcriptional regulator